MDGWAIFMWAALVGIVVFVALLVFGLGGTAYYTIVHLLPAR